MVRWSCRRQWFVMQVGLTQRYRLRLNDIALRVDTSELWDITCSMRSYSVTCHPTQVNAPSLTPASKADIRWVDLVAGYLPSEMVYPPAVGYPSKYWPGPTYRATLLIETNSLPLSHATTLSSANLLCWRLIRWRVGIKFGRSKPEAKLPIIVISDEPLLVYTLTLGLTEHR